MGGWKTLTSAALSIGYGAVGYYIGLHEATVAVGFINAGIATVGIGHKIEKNTEAVKTETAVIGQVVNKRTAGLGGGGYGL